MSLFYCEGCHIIEGPTKLLEEDGHEVRVCAECDEEIQNIPEHDDFDGEFDFPAQGGGDL